ncbi:TIGR03617 family F420-dependent LLM class oxidoreductase [Gordonia polyisoprenivorans]|uniref:TIGR03617 family F420-dependent LLM class oxidoreductase n=1 Tax=Gordonia polyisoprenivorans TaxID=84595 RepID=UPI000479E5ED|nr:TIGR03617 family F420-dependent LLM class oxidoreductase [Gordonia polyisoprenivorans]
MLIDMNIGGPFDGTAGGDIATTVHQIRDAVDGGFAGVWTTEVSHNPFFPLILAAEHGDGLDVGTAAIVAFARNPMSLAIAANDVQQMSGGRLILGLGTQVKPHIRRRFDMPWSEPIPRLREYLAALREIWRAIATGEHLDFRGDYYQHTLFPPMFRPRPHDHAAPPILITAVGERMTRLAAEVADGILLHGFTTQRYLREVTSPAIDEVLAAHDRSRSDFTISYPGFVVTGTTDDEIATAAAAVRRQIAFYGSTPAYAKVLEHHGWGDLHRELHRLSTTDGWSSMSALIDDDVLSTFAVVGTPEEAGATAAQKFGDLVDRFTFYAPYPTNADVRATFAAAAGDARLGTR